MKILTDRDKFLTSWEKGLRLKNEDDQKCKRIATNEPVNKGQSSVTN